MLTAADQLRDRWLATLAELADRSDLHGLLQGRIVRLLTDAEVLDDAAVRVGRALSYGVDAAAKAAWVEGFFADGALLLIHDPALRALLDGWVGELTEAEFTDMLPLVRRTFGTFTPAERRTIAGRLSSTAGADRCRGSRPRTVGARAGHRRAAARPTEETRRTMSIVTENQPDGTPTWIDLGIPDLDRALEFYGALFGWQFDVGPAEFGRYTMAYAERPAGCGAGAERCERPYWWNVYLATADCDATAAAVQAAGGTVINPPMDMMDQGRMAIVHDPAGGQFGLWQGRAHVGCERVNEPNSLVRNDLVTDQPEVARRFYAEVFGFTLDRNADLPEFDFTFLRRPDGHEVGGIMGMPSGAGTQLVDDVRGRRHRRRGGASGGGGRDGPGRSTR